MGEPIKLPNGNILNDVPEGATKAQVMDRAIKLGLATQADFGAPAASPAPMGAPAPRTGPPAEGMGYVSGLAGQALQGLTASWGDEIVSAAVSGFIHAGDALGATDNVTGGESVMDTYAKIRDRMRDQNEQFRQDYPKASLAANVAGGMLPVSKVLNAAGSGAKGVAAATGVGAGWGGADYLGELSKFTDFEILEAAKRIGLGGAIPAGMAGGKGVWHWIKNREKDEVAAILSELVRHTNKTADEIKQQALKMGPDASLVDATGDVGVGYAQATRGVGAMDVADTMEKNLWPKLARAKDRIRGTLKSVTGKGENEYHDTLDGLVTSRKKKATELYGKALDQGSVKPTDKMVDIMNQNPSVRDAYNRVADTWSREGREIPKVFNIDPESGKIIKTWRGGEDVSKTVPNMRFLQEMKFELDRMKNTLAGSVDSAGKLQYSRLRDDASEFLDEIYKQNPDFKKANEVFAGDMALEGAMKMGRKHGLGRGNVDDQLDYIAGLSKSEKTAYLQGLMSDVYNTLGKSGSGVKGEELLGNLNSLTSRNSKKVLEKLVGKDGTKRLMNTINTQKRFKEVDTKVRHGSETAPRQAAVESMKKRNEQFNVEDLKEFSVANRALDKLVRMLPSKYGKLGPEQLNELADIITKPNGVPAAIERLSKHGYNKFEISELLKYMVAAGIAIPPATGQQQFTPTPVPQLPPQKKVKGLME